MEPITAAKASGTLIAQKSAGSSIYYYSTCKAFVKSLVKTAAIKSNAFCILVNRVMVPRVVNIDIMPFDENTNDK
jgi:hypothetical protein